MRQPPKPAPMPPPSERFTSRAGTGLFMFLSLLVVQRGGDSLRFWRCRGATRKEREREKKRLGEEHCCSSISTAARFPTPKSSSFQPRPLFCSHDDPAASLLLPPEPRSKKQAPRLAPERTQQRRRLPGRLRVDSDARAPGRRGGRKRKQQR